jgi:hypothetical protein
MAEPAKGPYRVIYSENLRAQLREWGHEAVRLGCGLQYAEVLRTIDSKLVSEATTWGDPQFRQRHLQLVVYRGIHSVFRVSYAVHETEPLVFVRS